MSNEDKIKQRHLAQAGTLMIASAAVFLLSVFALSVPSIVLSVFAMCATAFTLPSDPDGTPPGPESHV